MSEVNAKIPETGAEATVNYDFGGNIENAVDKFGAEAVYAVFEQQATVKLQAVIRGMLKKGATPEEIQARVDKYVIGTVNRAEGTGKSTEEKLLKSFAKMSVDEQVAFLAKLKSQAENK